VEAHRDKPPGGLLRRSRERLLALALTEVELCGRGDSHLDHPVGELSGNHFIEPDPIEPRMLGAHLLQHALPKRGI
jgi:hypothetical protein